jgi:hypothetical protein
MPASLEGVRAKLDRAEDHLNAVAEELRRLVEGHRDAVRVEQDSADKSLYRLIAQNLPDIQPSVGVILGDFLHDTRSALDHLVHELVVLAGGTPHNRHQFPILDAKGDWKGKVVQPGKKGLGMLDFIDPAHVAVIESLQPYTPTTGLKSLALLRDFSNTDKHRLIPSAFFAYTATPSVGVKIVLPAEIEGFNFSKSGEPLENDAEIGRIRPTVSLPIPPGSDTPELPSNAEMDVGTYLKMTTKFGPVGNRWARVREFRALLGEVRSIVDGFTAHFS